MHINEEKVQQALLVAVNTGDYDAWESLDELEELAKTAGAEVVAKVVQNMATINNATYLGSGKIEEVKELCESKEIDIIIFDDELSGAQIRNIEQELSVQVIDRTMLILDIFATRAISKEGKLQVELAQQKYLLPRLIGMGKLLSRQGGGIGTRGPGETKLESDKRHIRRRIENLTAELRELEKRRERVRQRRSKNDVVTIAIVGYTNVGKSTLLNLLTQAGVLVKNQLFATLDPTARELKLPDGRNAIFVDTVGLIRRLPHQLVEAFKSTLEEAANADLILNLCDISNPLVNEQIEVTKKLLEELGCGETPVLTVFNKTDLYEWQNMITITPTSTFISAKEDKGIDKMLQLICENLDDGMKLLELLIPYDKVAVVDKIRKTGKIIEESYENDGMKIKANVDIKMLKSVEEYVVSE